MKAKEEEESKKMAEEERIAIIDRNQQIMIRKEAELFKRAQFKWIHLVKLVRKWKNKQKMDICKGFLKFILQK
jgi:hypothetical protein